MKTFFFTTFRFIHVYFFSISYNRLKIIEKVVDNSIKAVFVSTDDYRICCLLNSKNTSCSSKPKWPQTCAFLLEVKFVRVLSILEGIGIIIFNLIAFIINWFLSMNKGKVQSTFQIIKLLLNMNDAMYGLYLLVLLKRNGDYNRPYVLYETEWRESYMCIGLGILSLFVISFSVFLLVITSVCRLIAVKFPFCSHFKSVKIMTKYLVTGFVGVIFFCVIVVIFYLVIEERNLMPDPTCLFLGKISNSMTITLVTSIIAVLQIGAFVSITMMFTAILLENKKSIENISQAANDKHLLFQTFFQTFTYAVCWLPSSAILMTSIIMERYPVTLLTWNAILINPINSLINPIFFCFIPLIKNYVK